MMLLSHRLASSPVSRANNAAAAPRPCLAPLPSKIAKQLHPRPVTARATAEAATSSDLTPPSSRAAANELQSLALHSTIVPDSLQFDTQGAARLKAATVSYGALTSIVKSQSLGFQPLKNAVASAMNYDACAGLKDASARLDCRVDKALANVGAALLGQVADGGAVATQVDPSLSHDTALLVAKAKHLAALYADMGVPKSRLVMRIPATWAGIQAAGQLEAAGIATQVYHVYCLAQGVAAMQAGVSVLQVAVGSVREWYDQNPGAIRDPKGPRQDAGGLAAGPDPGLKLVQDLYCYGRVHHPKTRIMASAIRSRQDALALAGVDWQVMSRRVAEELAATFTTQGYNDGLVAAGASGDEAVGGGVDVALSPEVARRAAPAKLPAFTEASLAAALCPAATALLARGLASQAGDVTTLKTALRTLAGGQE